MLSAWLNFADLYLAHGLAILKIGASSSKAIDLPTTLPWDKSLLLVTEALEEIQRSGKQSSRLRVMLSGTLCRAIAIQAPSEARNWNDLRQLLLLSSTTMLGASSDQLSCAQDTGCAAIGAASSANMMQALESWAGKSKFRLHQIQPSWSIASHSKLARSDQFTAMQITEPDGITLLSQTQAELATCHISKVTPTLEIENANVRRQLTSWGIDESRLLKLNFVVGSATTLPGGPSLWASHWRGHAATAD